MFIEYFLRIFEDAVARKTFLRPKIRLIDTYFCKYFYTLDSLINEIK